MVITQYRYSVVLLSSTFAGTVYWIDVNVTLNIKYLACWQLIIVVHTGLYLLSIIMKGLMYGKFTNCFRMTSVRKVIVIWTETNDTNVKLKEFSLKFLRSKKA